MSSGFLDSKSRVILTEVLNWRIDLDQGASSPVAGAGRDNIRIDGYVVRQTWWEKTP
jgi:hypothetical protein